MIRRRAFGEVRRSNARRSHPALFVVCVAVSIGAFYEGAIVSGIATLAFGAWLLFL